MIFGAVWWRALKINNDYDDDKKNTNRKKEQRQTHCLGGCECVGGWGVGGDMQNTQRVVSITTIPFSGCILHIYKNIFNDNNNPYSKHTIVQFRLNIKREMFSHQRGKVNADL